MKKNKNKRITDDRIKHMHGVAEYMYAHAREYGLDPELMYILGLNHDIGYMNGKEGHEKEGGALMALSGYIYDDCIRWHGCTPSEWVDAHVPGVDFIPLELALLWEADMHVDLTGEDVGYDKRLKGVAKRYGKSSHAYKVCAETIKWLEGQAVYMKATDEDREMLESVFKD